MQKLLAALVIGAPLALAACGGGGADSSTSTEVRTTTTGQELTDLKTAYDSGAITKKEYDDERKKILARD